MKDKFNQGIDDIRHMNRDLAIAKLRKHKAAVTFADLPGDKGLVVKTGSRVCVVEIGGEPQRFKTFEGIAVGDMCTVREGKVVSIHPRRTILSRPSPANALEEKVLAANVDLVVVVASVGAPPLRPGLIDRCTVAAQHGGASPIVCINKMDLLTDEGELQVLEGYRQAGVPVVLCSTYTGQGVSELADLLAGSMCVLTGHSGTGKSAMLNQLCPTATQATGEVVLKGQHTTTSSSVHRMPNGGRVIDTPGVREFGLWKLPASELRLYFPEFVDLADACHFRDCTHTHEPQCAVRDAGLRRYPMYLRILSGIE